MTDEEKAEEYADECFKGNDKDSQYYRTILIKAYLDGLAEGRKETYEKLLEEVRAHTGIKQLTFEQLTIEQLTKFSMEEQCKFCKEHCGEVYHFNLAKNNFELEKENAELEEIRSQQARIINNNTVRIETLEKENARLSKMLEMAINEVLLCGKQMKAEHPSMIVWTEETFRAELEKRVENEND